MTHKRYLVTGKRQYRWHAPGTVFEAKLDPDAERRAIERGSIRVLEEVDIRVENYRLPHDWPSKVNAGQTETPASVGVSQES